MLKYHSLCFFFFLNTPVCLNKENSLCIDKNMSCFLTLWLFKSAECQWLSFNQITKTSNKGALLTCRLKAGKVFVWNLLVYLCVLCCVTL